MEDDRDDLSRAASEGGHARAKALTAEERSDIARAAAKERWSKAGKDSPFPKQIRGGILKFGSVEIECANLDNGMRVLSTRGVTRAFGGRTTGTAKFGARQIPPFLTSERLKPFISQDLMARAIQPIEYQPLRGGRTAFGHEATMLPAMCKAIVEANRKGRLLPSQVKYAIAAEVILEGMAVVGIVALIDAATGFEKDRAKDDLMRILEGYISRALIPWTRTFQPEFFAQVCRLHGWPQMRRQGGRIVGPRYVGKFVREVIYEQLPDGVLAELERKNPNNEKGYRRHKHFQFLTPEIGNPHLTHQLAAVMGLMRASTDKDEFWRLFRRAFPDKKASKALVVTAQMRLEFPPAPETVTT